MKKIAFVFATIFAVSVLTLAFKNNQQQPEISVKMTIEEWRQVFFMVDNAAVAGEIRKPLLEKMGLQFNAQVKALQDTTKPKTTDGNTKVKPKS